MAEKIRKTFRNASGQPVSGIAATLSLQNVDTGAILSNFIELGVSGSYETTAEVPHGTWALYVSGVKSADEFVVDPTRTSSVNQGTFKDVLIDRVIGSTLSIYQFLRIADGDGAAVTQTMLSDAVDAAVDTGNVIEIGGKHAGGSRNSIVITATKNFSVSSASGYRIFIDLGGAILAFNGTPWSFNGVRPCFKNGIIQGDNNSSFPITFDRGADFEYIDFVNCDPTRDNTSTFRSLCYGCRGIPAQQFTDNQGDITTKVSIVGSPDNTYGTIADTVISMADNFVPNGTGVTSTKQGSSTTMVKKFQKFIISSMARTMEVIGWMVGWTQPTFTALKYLADVIYPSVTNAKSIYSGSRIYSSLVHLASDPLNPLDGTVGVIERDFFDVRMRGYVELPTYSTPDDENLFFNGDHFRMKFVYDAVAAPESSQNNQGARAIIRTGIAEANLPFTPQYINLSFKNYYRDPSGSFLISDGKVFQWVAEIDSVTNGDWVVGTPVKSINHPVGYTYWGTVAEGVAYESQATNVINQDLL